jgi:hypothetical protein
LGDLDGLLRVIVQGQSRWLWGGWLPISRACGHKRQRALKERVFQLNLRECVDSPVGGAPRDDLTAGQELFYLVKGLIPDELRSNVETSS